MHCRSQGTRHESSISTFSACACAGASACIAGGNTGGGARQPDALQARRRRAARQRAAVDRCWSSARSLTRALAGAAVQQPEPADRTGAGRGRSGQSASAAPDHSRICQGQLHRDLARALGRRWAYHRRQPAVRRRRRRHRTAADPGRPARPTRQRCRRRRSTQSRAGSTSSRRRSRSAACRLGCWSGGRRFERGPWPSGRRPSTTTQTLKPNATGHRPRTTDNRRYHDALHPANDRAGRIAVSADQSVLSADPGGCGGDVPLAQAIGAPVLQLLSGRSGLLWLARLALTLQIVVLAWRLPPAGRGAARLWWVAAGDRRRGGADV